MLEIREFAGASDPVSYATLARLHIDAYPVMGIDSQSAFEQYVHDLQKHDDNSEARFAVATNGGELVGAMKLYDYTMNVRGRDAATGGVGAVAVSPASKRTGIARALIAWYLDGYRQRGATFAVLHPFRLDFYRKLGFGYGTPVHRYRFALASLHSDGARGRVRALGSADIDAVLACCERVRATTNGLIAKQRVTMQRALAGMTPKYVGVDVDGTLRGFMQTSVTLGAPNTANANELAVRDVHAEDDPTLAALFAYLSAQRDQFAYVTIESNDDALYLASNDPRDGSDGVIAPPAAHRIAGTGLGVMYRILDVPKAFAHLGTRPGASGARSGEAIGALRTLRVEVDDPFYPPTHGAWTFACSQGSNMGTSSQPPDATLRIGIADLGSLVVGSLGVRALVRHRRAQIEPAAALDAVSELFAVDAPPRCETRF